MHISNVFARAAEFVEDAFRDRNVTMAYYEALTFATDGDEEAALVADVFARTYLPYGCRPQTDLAHDERATFFGFLSALTR